MEEKMKTNEPSLAAKAETQQIQEPEKGSKTGININKQKDREKDKVGSGWKGNNLLKLLLLAVTSISATFALGSGWLSFVLEAFNGHQRLVDILSEAGYNMEYGIRNQLCTLESCLEPLFVWMLVVFLGSFIALCYATGHRREDREIHARWIDRVPFAVYTGAWVGAEIFLAMVFVSILDVIDDSSYWVIKSSSWFYLAKLDLAVFCIAAFLGFTYFMSLVVRVKTHTFWKTTLCYWISKPVRRFWNLIRVNVPLFVKVFAVFFLIFILEAFFLRGYNYHPYRYPFYLMVIKGTEFVALVVICFQMYRLREGGKRIASGDYEHPIDTNGMFSDFKKHAENLNSVSSGIAAAVEERMKSEHFKTELITNVSHDIKTPLTSIINYVDLISKEEVSNPKVEEYIEVLDRQSNRLKKLIEDLMEASKASTGNIKVELERCDATVMLTQVVGEFEERAKQNQLELIVESPEPPVEILADGRHLWRVIDNLMGNICKYAMPATRVYITLEDYHGMVIMTFRNISKERLTIGSEELMERFVRGDSSRNTEGSGLGLSIAQSLVQLMNGNMAIMTDGDLFKAIVSFPKV